MNELTPMKIREYFLSVRQQIEEYSDFLKGQLEDANQEIKKKNDEIANLQTVGTQKARDIEELEQERDRISAAASSLQEQITNLRHKYESEDVIVWRMPRIDMSAFFQIDTLYKKLSEVLTKDISTQYSDLFRTLSKSYQPIMSEEFLRALTTREISKPPKTPETNSDSNNEERDDEEGDANNDDSVAAG